MLNMIMV